MSDRVRWNFRRAADTMGEVVPVRSSSVAVLALSASLFLHVAGAAGVLVAGRMHASAENAADPSPQLAGETFELAAPEAEPVPLQNASPAPDLAAEGAPADSRADSDPVPVRPTPPTHHAKPAARASNAGRPSAGRDASGATPEPGGGGGEKLYGAVGDRSAADVATAFTRGFAQAASMNPVWAQAPLGGSGDAVVVLELDDAGKLVGQRIEGTPSAALASGIRSTLTLIGARSFVARGKVTRLHVSAVISSSEPRDDMHGVYGIGGSFVAGEGHAFFSLPVGRKIDVRVRGR